MYAKKWFCEATEGCLETEGSSRLRRELAARIGKICRKFDARGSPPRRPGATWHDAVVLASLIKLLAKRGGSRPAAEATEIAEYVELLLDLLRSEIT